MTEAIPNAPAEADPAEKRFSDQWDAVQLNMLLARGLLLQAFDFVWGRCSSKAIRRGARRVSRRLSFWLARSPITSLHEHRCQRGL
jgi:hypothetical protein